MPDKDTVHTQTKEAPRLMKQSRVISLEIAPPEFVLPTLKPPTVYMHDEQKKRFVSNLMTDPAKAALIKNPLKPGMTFKE